LKGEAFFPFGQSDPSPTLNFEMPMRGALLHPASLFPVISDYFVLFVQSTSPTILSIQLAFCTLTGFN
jgi:hypothetical protein